jgi:hypothetical protein
MKPLAGNGGDLVRELQRDLHFFHRRIMVHSFKSWLRRYFYCLCIGPVEKHVKSTRAWRAAEIVFSLTPNSASAERVFSFLQVFMATTNQEHKLVDPMKSLIMLCNNKREL